MAVLFTLWLGGGDCSIRLWPLNVPALLSCLAPPVQTSPESASLSQSCPISSDDVVEFLLSPPIASRHIQDGCLGDQSTPKDEHGQSSVEDILSCGVQEGTGNAISSAHDDGLVNDVRNVVLVDSNTCVFGTRRGVFYKASLDVSVDLRCYL